ncbi:MULTISPECIES: hypothetical protein [unclassified Streptosporangium]|uniref:hypothetical protein n=1 Tax=unclassified Streptosporangium TaxID=2632669 RepID=UPI002E297DB6|nr:MULTISPECIES: hypothetical protein [unclassified Streptosporangium]
MTISSAQEQYLHLVRLAWDLRRLGMGVRIELPASEEPYVAVLRESGALRVLALARGKKWVFMWGRGRSQWIAALDEDAVRHIHEAATR